jgi:hypothetical protein
MIASPGFHLPKHSIRPDVCLERIRRAEQVAMMGLSEHQKWLVPLTLALARLAAAHDVAQLGHSCD